MIRMWRLVALVCLPVLLSGCVAAVIPVVAGGVIARSKQRQKQAHVGVPAPTTTAPVPNASTQPAVAPTPVDIPGSVPVPNGFPAALAAQPPAPEPPAPLATIETAAAPTDFAAYAVGQTKLRTAANPGSSVVLAEHVDLAQPAFIPCLPQQSFAVIIDIDHPLALKAKPSLFNLTGLASAALAQLRATGVKIFWLSERDSSFKTKLQAKLVANGLFDVKRDNLSLKHGADDRKQTQRFAIAAQNCVIAIAGHDRDDFDELFDYVLHEDSTEKLAPLWGHGWFLLSPKHSKG